MWVLGVLVLYAAFYSNQGLNKWVSWKKQPGVRLLLGIILTQLVSCTLTYLAIFGYHKFSNVQLLITEHADELIKIGILLFCLSLIYGVVYFAIYSYNQYATGQVLELQHQQKKGKASVGCAKVTT